MSEKFIYTCSCCKKTFKSNWTNEDALREKEKLFPNISIEDTTVSCEDCFIKIMDFNEPGLKRYEN